MQLMKTPTKMKKKTRVVKKMFQSTQMRNMTSLARLLTTEPVAAVDQKLSLSYYKIDSFFPVSKTLNLPPIPM